MNANLQKFLSGLAVAAVTAAATAIEQAASNPPFTLHTLLVAAGVGALVGALHYIPAVGTKEAVIKSLLEGNEAAAVEKVLAKETLAPPKVPTNID